MAAVHGDDVGVIGVAAECADVVVAGVDGARGLVVLVRWGLSRVDWMKEWRRELESCWVCGVWWVGGGW